MLEVNEVYSVNWDKAPLWARYAAMDSDGKIFFYEDMPTAMDVAWNIEGALEGCFGELANEDAIVMHETVWKIVLKLGSEVIKSPRQR